MKISWARITFVIVCFVAALHYAASDCCGRERIRNGESEPVCNDCTNGTPCCGNGHCNIFCCGCDDGCLVWDEQSTGNCPARQRRGIPLMRMPYYHHHHFPIFHHNESDVHSILKFADYDNDGQLNFGESDYYLRHLTKANHYTGYKDLKALDKNNNGFLSIDEIDPKQVHVVDVIEVDHRVPGGEGQGGDIGVGEAGQEGFIGGEDQGQDVDASQGGSIGYEGQGQDGDIGVGEAGQEGFIGGGDQGQDVDATGDASQGGSIGYEGQGQDGDIAVGEAGQEGFIGGGDQGQDRDATGDASQGGSIGDEGQGQGGSIGGEGQDQVGDTSDQGDFIGGGGHGNEGVPIGDAGLSQEGDESGGQSDLEDDRVIDIDTRIAGDTQTKV